MEKFDFEEFKSKAKAELKLGKKDLLGKEGLLTPLIKNVLEECLEAELSEHLCSEKTKEKVRSK